MNLEDVHRGITKHKPRKRIGRGPGSGTGKTSGRGHKGHKSRSGYSRKPVFQGGAMPMIRRIPKRGFHNKWGVEVFAVNVATLDKAFEDGDEVTLEILSEKHIAKGTFDEVKILGDGELTKKLTVTAHRFSKQAEEKITKAGGTVNRIAPKRTPKERVAALKNEQSS
ncbi:50S ribosomal protein L15 [Roseimaritima ulvae]|uniref:Large ribosomal subunit protein uL15 n=1 Tax=Roseimaritima ulvae TaxID=980254 RepID=A0A5B9QKV8_9BACT|nr:50S ribosomal protein L15 [Roseimaritima ulvae]QEG39534.1 50S ribosomal protein L15 [Roseimaritima ulvae]